MTECKGLDLPSKSWIGVDLDGCLAVFGWKGVDHVGDPVPLMVERVKQWLREGIEVRIFTARVGETGDFVQNSQATDDHAFAMQQTKLIEDWCEKHIGQKLRVTATKDYAMACLYDDRCVQVEANTGRLIG